MIVLKNVSFSYGDLDVLKKCSLQFESGETHLIIGSTAAGKTTLGLLIAQLLKPDRGRVVFPRGNIKDIRREMGFLFQFPEDLFFNETVYEEIAYGAKRHHIKNIEERVHSAIEMVGLNDDFFMKSPFNLSEGEKRLVALASILVWDPSWIILDEPFSGLDWQARERLVKTIKELKGEVGIILISHHIDDIIEYVNQVILLVEGEIAFASPPDEVDWDMVFESGCDIPYGVKMAKRLRDNGIDVSLEYSIPRLIQALKK
ncbi:ATP-binding cassette domain-containing protein [candidate division WOR-3 bacterium]|nr:ATP-binding cassette domain-containing protein [candidate division WOR-3 bacterium]